jgi:urease accessory protein UreE
MFRSLPVVRDVHRGELPASAAQFGLDTITLGWEERLRVRGRRRSDQGIDFGTALPRGTVLRGGDWLLIEGLATAVAVVELEEPVFIIWPQSPAEWAVFAYHIGNSHQPVMITDTEIVCAILPGMTEVLNYHGIPFDRGLQPFTPLGLERIGHRHQP